MKLICTLTLVLLSSVVRSQDYGWKTIYSSGSSVIQYRVVVHHVKYLGDAGDGWATKIFCRSTFNEAVDYSLVADVTYPNDASFHGKTERGHLLGWGVLYDKNNRQNGDVGDWVSWTNARFERLTIGRQKIIKDGVQIGAYNPNNLQSGGQSSNDSQDINRDITGNDAQRQAALDQERQHQEQQRAQEAEQVAAQDRQRQQEAQQQEQQQADEQRKRDEAQRVQANIDQINRNYQAQSAAISDAAQALGQLASVEKVELSETHDFLAITGGITNLISPFLTSNRTASLNGSPINYYGSMHLLNRGILSINATISGVKMKDETFKFYGYNSNGGQSEFSGTLEAQAMAYQLSIGKDFVTKDGRFHFYLAPMLTYWSSLEHKFTYNGSQTYIQKDIKNSQLLYGIDSQIYWFFDDTFGLNAGIKYNIFASEAKDSFYYKPTNFASWNIGLALRFF